MSTTVFTKLTKKLLHFPLNNTARDLLYKLLGGAGDIEVRTGAGACSVETKSTVFSGAAGAVTLAAGQYEGQQKFFRALAASTATLTPVSLDGGTTLTFAATQSCILEWHVNKWYILANTTTLA